MASGWLYAMDIRGLLVTPKFMERLKARQTAALRELAKTDLTALYRRSYTKLTLEQMQPGLFWSEQPPPLVLIPFVRGGPHPPPVWLPEYVTYRSRKVNRKVVREVGRLAKGVAPGDLYKALHIKYDSEGVTVTAMKPNPKFELVVVNKYDRAALLHLLAATDGESSNVEQWLAKRTKEEGATQADVLYADYESWCKRQGLVATGTKSFSQALVAARVVKLKRGNGGSRYALTLRHA